MHKVIIFWLLLPCFGTSLRGQFTVTPAYPAVEGRNGTALPLAWLGGLNAPQWNATDLDGDGTGDLLLFDRAGDALLALRGTDDGYALAPELTAGFPADLISWVLLRDYDRDGIDDLIAYSAEFSGVRIYRGERGQDGILQFPAAPTYPGLTYPLGNGTTPVFITSIDYPAFDDLDGDGDLDLLTFSVAGGYVEYYRNQSVERGFATDTLIYTLDDECWGGFFETSLTPTLQLAEVAGACVRSALPVDVEPRHAGSTLLTLDANGNGLKDIMLGDISFNRIVLGFNTGTPEQAFISSQDDAWRAEGTSVDIASFPAAFHLDVDRDGARDIVVSPNQTLNAEDLNVGWYYRNVGTDAAPDFRYQTSELLVEESIDFGSGSIPATFDYDADGRPDLIVGNTERYRETGTLAGQLRLYRNVTPAGGATAFAFVDDDYLQLSQYQATTSAFSPAFGDLDGDGDEDAIVGDRGGTLIYLRNTAGPDQPAVFDAPVFDYMGIDVVQFAKPVITDLDRDGLKDLVVGGFDGRIRFYRNVGTAGAPSFDPDPNATGNRLQLGGINTNVPGLTSGHPTPQVLDYGDRFVLITGNRAGNVEAYAFTDYQADFTVLNRRVASLDVGAFSNPTLADFNGNGLLEMIVGNQRGGVSFYTTDLLADKSTGLFSSPVKNLTIGATPNPTSGLLNVTDLPGTQVQYLRVLDATGRLLRQLAIPSVTQYTLDLAGLPPGLYLAQVTTDRGSGTVRLVVR